MSRARKVVSLISVLILAALILSVLRSQPANEPVSAPASSATTTTIARTDTSSIATTPPTTVFRSVTDSTVTTEAEEQGLRAEFVLTEVVFGDNGYAVITNVGGAAGSLEGYALCQKPEYLVFDPIDVAPFATVWVAFGDASDLVNPSVIIVAANGELGQVVPRDGEMALYRSAQFSSAAELRSYVEWGESGHGRSSVAIEAGLWSETAFVEIPSDAFGVVAIRDTPASIDDWVASLGG